MAAEVEGLPDQDSAEAVGFMERNCLEEKWMSDEGNCLFEAMVSTRGGGSLLPDELKLESAELRRLTVVVMSVDEWNHK